MTGLLLGAGASHELGMPLVTELTAEFKAYLNADHVKTLSIGWKAQGSGFSDDVIDELNAVVANPATHYEAIIGHFQTKGSQTAGSKSEEYRHLSIKLTDLVYGLLYSRHIRNIEYIDQGLRFFDGLLGLADRNAPLWIFSLNHDMMIECIANAVGLTVSAGLPKQGTIPRRNSEGEIIGLIHTESLPGDVLETQGPAYLPPGERGINLLKLHGGLDLFMTTTARTFCD
jgi:hypothetical protein